MQHQLLPGQGGLAMPVIPPARLRPGSDLQVRRIAAGESLGDVQRLRRDVYFGEQGRTREYSKRISDGLDGCGTTLVVEKGTHSVATLRMHDFSAAAVQVEYGSLFQIDQFARSWPLHSIAVGTRFAVQADQRAKPVVERLFREAYCWGRENEVRFCLIACEPFLHDVFEHYGFREYLPPAILRNGMGLLRMVQVLDDAPQWLEMGEEGMEADDNDPQARARVSRNWLNRTFRALV